MTKTAEIKDHVPDEGFRRVFDNDPEFRGRLESYADLAYVTAVEKTATFYRGQAARLETRLKYPDGEGSQLELVALIVENEDLKRKVEHGNKVLSDITMKLFTQMTEDHKEKKSGNTDKKTGG